MTAQVPIRTLADQWLRQDQDPSTRREIQDLLQANDEAELEKRLRQRIAFGTAGLRSSMKAGYAHMNCLTVNQASHGLATYVWEQQRSLSARTEALSIVVGYDARHNSEAFARVAAGAFVSMGLRVLWFGQHVHTPMVPFAVTQYKAVAGVMVTASHNPKADNGYKVYWANGCQIIPPHDRGIAAAIERVDDTAHWDERAVDTSPLVQCIFSDATTSYFSALRGLLPPPDKAPKASFAYTPMHGVGLPFMQQVADMFEFTGNKMQVVEAQAQPDPEFPTVPFPNPEEKGALNLAFAEAERRDSSIVLANDPDADRFAVAHRLPSGSWLQFTGNQMGALLASHVFETYERDRSKLAMLASTVSSRMLAAMAKVEGFHFRETLTGFKWLGNIAQTLQADGYDAAYAYEEAIGYMFPSVVWDKDGIAAAAVFLTAWQRWQEQGLTPWQKLQSLYEKYGYFHDANTYLISPSPHVTNRVFADIRTAGGSGHPATVGTRDILRWRDLTEGYDSAGVDGKPDLPVDPTAQMITCELESVVFTARGSGTEPKIKLYIEATAGSSEEAQRTADEVLHDLLREWFRPEYGLRLAGS